MISSFVAAYLFADKVAEFWKLSGMLVGVYTGGTPNLMAIGMGLKVSEEALVLATASDAVLGGIYFVFLITAAKWLYSKFLPPFKGQTGVQVGDIANENSLVFNKGIIVAFLIAAASVGSAIGISFLFKEKIDVAIVMFVITSLGIMASFVKRIRNIKGTYEMGQYIILVFSLALGTNVNFSEMVSSSPWVFAFTAFVMTASILINLVLAAMFKIDVDTTILTSTAGIYGPAFIPSVAVAIKNKEAVISGLTCGLVGYAVGNYLGFALAWFLMPR